MKLVKWTLGIIAGLFIVVGIAIVVLPNFVPMERIVAEGAKQVEAATGRKLTVGGDPELSIWPEVAIRVSDVAFANAPGATDPQMATIEAVRVRVPIMPLLSGAVEIEEFVLVKPNIRLEVDKNGKPNWSFAPAGAPAAKPAEGADTNAGGGLPEQLKTLKLGDVRIEDGRIAYRDASSGAEETLEDVDLKLTLDSLDSPLTAVGGLVWKGERIEIDTTIAKPLAVMEAGATGLKANVSGNHLKLDFDGEANFAAGFALAGKAGFETPSIKNLAAWAAAPIPVEGDVLGPFSAKGDLGFGGGKIAFDNAEIALDAIRGTGALALETAGAKPFIAATMKLGELDLNPYLPAPAEGGGGSGGDAGPGKWSDAPIDFSGLGAVNAVIDLTVEKLLIQEIKVGKSRLVAKLRESVLRLELAEMALYGGSGTAKVRIDAAQETPRITKSIALKGIQAEPLLTDAAQFSTLAGAGDLEFNLSAIGGSEAALVQSLRGKGSFVFRNGAVKGFNLGAMVRKAEGAFLNASAGKAQQTDFSELSATFVVNKGIAVNKDLSMKAPLFRISGAGDVDMPARTVDYRVEPKAVASAKGQGGSGDIAGVSVPVLIKGPWHDVSYRPDLAGAAKDLLKSPEKALEAVRDVAGGVGGAAKDALKDPKSALPGAGGLKNLLSK